MKALNRLSGLDVSFVSLVNRAAVRDPSNPSEPMRFALTKSEAPVVDMTAAGATPNQGGHMPETEAELRAALEKAEQENAELRKAAKKAAKKAGKQPQPTDQNPDPDHDGDNDRTPEGDTDHDYQPAPKGGKMSKSDELTKAELAKAEERIQKAEERAKAAEKIAKQERDLRVRSEFVEVAKSELPHLGNPDELGAELHRLSDVLTKDEFEAHLTRQRAANEQIAKGDLYAQIGRDGSPDPSTANAVDKVRKQAAEIRKADPSVDSYDAMRQAVNANPDLILANR